MDATNGQISDAEMAKKMRKRLKTSFNEALEAHDKAMNSQSDVAIYNSSILRKLEKAFIANPEVDLLSDIPPSYLSSVQHLAKSSKNEVDPLEAASPPAKRIKIAESDGSREEEIDVPKHLQHLHEPGASDLKSPMDQSVTDFFRGDMTANNVIRRLCPCQLISQDMGSGLKMIIRLDDNLIVKIRPTATDAREY